MVARSTVLARAETIWPYGSVPYSQSAIHQPDGYRQDCSGFASLCWAIPPGQWGGENTESLVTEGWMYEISADELLPGDAVGMCGPGTLGDAGHIQIFDHWTATGLEIWEQAGGTFGPRQRPIKRITPGYRAYRFRDITEAESAPPQRKDDDMQTYQIARDNHTGQLYLCDGMTSRPIADTDVAHIKTLAAEGLFGLANGGATRDSWYPGAFGPVPATGGGSSTAGPVDLSPKALADVEELVDKQLDQQSRAGADQD